MINYCLYDTGEIIPEFIRKYNLKGQELVEIDTHKAKSYGVNLMQREISHVSNGDYVRHNPEAIAASIIELICDDLKFSDMENNTQYMVLNNKLKNAKKSLKEDKKEKKIKNNNKEKITKGKSKFYKKYEERIKSIRESELKQKEKREIEEKPVSKRGRKKKEKPVIEIKPLR